MMRVILFLLLRLLTSRGVLSLALSNTLSIASIIIDALAIIIAVVAICVAVHGNHQSQKQFQASMVKQEQALNAQLLDKRLQVLDYFRKEPYNRAGIFVENALYGENPDLELFRVLFSRALVQEYDDICLLDKERSRLSSSASDILEAFRHQGNMEPDEIEDVISYTSRIKAAKEKALSSKATDEDKEQFKKLSEHLSTTENDGNYGEMIMRANEMEKEVKRRKKHLIEAMTEEIRCSVDFTSNNQ